MSPASASDRVYELSLEARDRHFGAFGALSEMVLGRLAPIPGSVRAIRLAARPDAVMLFTDGHADPEEADEGVFLGAGLEFFVVDAAEHHPEALTAFVSHKSHLHALVCFAGRLASRQVRAMLLDPESGGALSSEFELADEFFEACNADPGRWRDPHTQRIRMLLWHTEVEGTDMTSTCTVVDSSLSGGQEDILAVGIVLLTHAEWLMIRDFPGGEFNGRRHMLKLLAQRGNLAQHCSLHRACLAEAATGSSRRTTSKAPTGSSRRMTSKKRPAAGVGQKKECPQGSIAGTMKSKKKPASNQIFKKKPTSNKKIGTMKKPAASTNKLAIKK